jgi:prevent-host-death family protein
LRFFYGVSMERISQRELRNQVSAVLLRVMAGERLRITLAGRDAADLVPIDERSTWTSSRRARTLIAPAQADPGLASELAAAFPDTTEEI